LEDDADCEVLMDSKLLSIALECVLKRFKFDSQCVLLNARNELKNLTKENDECESVPNEECESFVPESKEFYDVPRVKEARRTGIPGVVSLISMDGMKPFTITS